MKDNKFEEDDWRLFGEQDECLKNLKFQYKEYKNPRDGWDHDHCEFCWHKFMENPDGMENCSKQGYCSIDGRYWVCAKCFKDFKEKFNWDLID